MSGWSAHTLWFVFSSSLSNIKVFALCTESSASSLYLPSPHCPFLFIAFCPPPPLYLLCSCGVVSPALSQLSITDSFHLLALLLSLRHPNTVHCYALQSCHSVTSGPPQKSITHHIKRYPRCRALFASPRAGLFARCRDSERNNRRLGEEEDGAAPVDPIMWRLWGRTSQSWPVNAAIARPPTRRLLISLSSREKEGKHGHTGAIDRR